MNLIEFLAILVNFNHLKDAKTLPYSDTPCCNI